MDIFLYLNQWLLVKKISDRNIVWYEEPVRPMRDHKSIKKVAMQTGLPIAAGENEYTLNDFKQILEYL